MKTKHSIKLTKAILIAAFTVAISASFYLVDLNTSLLRTSVLDFPEHEPFDGTVYPIKTVPDWVNTTSSNWDLVYNEMPAGKFIDIPYYDPNTLKISADDLVWGDAGDNAVRNAKITYSVPYLGNYMLDGRENAGSHPAVDIKIPSGTPIYSIANGTVVKASNQSSGFGHHIVIQHDNFPALSNPNAKETIYSSYSHLSDIFISEGDVITKGEQIALSGSSGTATTPHLHFQIDTTDAPWHPYWPFTWQDAQDAGLDFFSAINAGLGKEDAKKTTVNPMKYVQAYLDGGASYTAVTATSTDNSDSSSFDDTSASSYVDTSNNSSDSDDEDPVVEPEPEIVVEAPEVREPSVFQVDFNVNSKYIVGNKYNFTLAFRDQYGEVFADEFTKDTLLTTARGNVKIEGPILGRLFMSSDASFEKTFEALRPGKDRFEIELGGEEYYSAWFDVIEIDGDQLFSDLGPEHQYYDEIMALVDAGIVAGYPDGTFKPDATVTRVEALKFILEGIRTSVETGNLPFSDVSPDEWYAKYLYTAYESGVVDGYPDGSFKPANTVNKAEFYKILFNGMGVDINPVVKMVPFDDVTASDWYAPYVTYASELGIIDDHISVLNASNGMTRAEVAYAIYKVMQVN